MLTLHRIRQNATRSHKKRKVPLTSAEQFSDEAEDFGKKDESLWSALTGAVTSLKDNASKTLSRFIEALAVMIVTSCVIPLLVLIFFIVLIRTATGITLPIPEPLRKIKKK